jgi:UDP-N-acetylmuramoylalanine--D-glutamate ligase
MLEKLDPPIHKKAEKYSRVAVFGAGLSGRSARSLAIKLGVDGCLFDEGGQGDASEFHDELLGEFDAFIFSPGFAAKHPWRVLVEDSSKPCYSELGFAASHWRGRLIGITGTNGKTSLTSLLCEALKDARINAVEAGNIGTPLSDYVLGDSNCDSTYAVCEISSFQAELTQGLKLDGLCWTNFAADHLNRHASMEEYFAAKRKLVECLQPDAPAFLGTSVHAFDPSVSEASNVFVIEEDSKWIEQLVPESPFRMPPQSANFALAAALWHYFDFSMKSLTDSANAFKLAAHRLSQVLEWGGVSFWNDSKATNFHAALAAIDAINTIKSNIYWIVGGSYKGGDIKAFVRDAAPKIRMAFLYGAVAEEMADHFRDTGSRFELHLDFIAAVNAATEAALKDTPSVVLLSPGFASYDQFPRYVARGDAFITTIFKLKDNYCTDSFQPHKFSD